MKQHYVVRDLYYMVNFKALFLNVDYNAIVQTFEVGKMF